MKGVLYGMIRFFRYEVAWQTAIRVEVISHVSIVLPRTQDRKLQESWLGQSALARLA